MLDSTAASTDSVVLDPYAGAGTTAIECQRLGIISCGFEINPFLHWVAKTSLDWSLSPHTVERARFEVQEVFEDSVTRAPRDIERLDQPIPPIHNPFRWWRKDVLRELLLLKAAVAGLPYQPQVKDFFRLALAAVLVPQLTNVTLGRLQLHFIDRSNDRIMVWGEFESHVGRMIEDLRKVQAAGWKPCSEVFLADSTDLRGMRLPRLVDRVITSPPYPNRYSYVWNTRPHLYFLDFFNRPRQASELDLKTAGGTWGTATSSLAKGRVEPACQAVGDVVGKLADEIRIRDNLMANYLVKYFNALARQIVEMDRLLDSHAQLAYVVGCSRLKGVYVETDILLAELLERLALGWSLVQIRRLRRRHSGINLHESVVYATRSGKGVS